MAFNEGVYENDTYRVVLSGDPVVIKGEPMNWEVVNKNYNTVEATVSALPNAIMIADEFSRLLKELLTPSETLN